MKPEIKLSYKTSSCPHPIREGARYLNTDDGIIREFNGREWITPKTGERFNWDEKTKSWIPDKEEKKMRCFYEEGVWRTTPQAKFEYSIHSGRYAQAIALFLDHGDESYLRLALEIIEDLTRQVENLQDEVDDYKMSKDDLEEQVEERDDKIDTLEKDLENANDKIDDLESELETLKDEYSDLESEFDNYKSEYPEE